MVFSRYRQRLEIEDCHRQDHHTEIKADPPQAQAARGKPQKWIVALLSCTLLVGIQTATCAPSIVASPMPQSKKPRATALDISRATVTELTAANRVFAFHLYHAIRGQDGNLFFSPYSLSVVLAMAYAGARGSTAEQMAHALRFTLSQDQLHPVFKALGQALTKPDRPFNLLSANAVWAQLDHEFRADFLNTIAANYDADVRLLDFKSDVGRNQARAAINRWASEQTQGKIDELLPQGILNVLTRLVLTNAIYFKADWATPFKHESTHDDEFTRQDGTKVKTPMMHRRGAVIYSRGADYEAVELPYKGGHAVLVAVLPVKGQFEAFERSLDAERAMAIIQSLHSKDDMILDLPKFQYATRLSLKDTLATLGMSDAFDRQKADFSGIDGAHDLRITHVIHKAFVSVDEKGTEAAAASGVSWEIISLPPTVRFDRPFIFFIYDKPTTAILFIGRMLDPTAE